MFNVIYFTSKGLEQQVTQGMSRAERDREMDIRKVSYMRAGKVLISGFRD